MACEQDKIKETESGWVLQSVVIRAAFGQQPRSGQKNLHQQQHAKKHGIGKKLLLTIRAIMQEEHVDLVAGDFNGAGANHMVTTLNPPALWRKHFPTNGRFVCAEPSKFTARRWASVQEVKIATTWTLSAINMLMSHEEITNNVSFSKKDPALNRLTKRKAGTTMKVTVHYHPCRPCESSCFHKQEVRRVKDIQPQMRSKQARYVLSFS